MNKIILFFLSITLLSCSGSSKENGAMDVAYENRNAEMPAPPPPAEATTSMGAGADMSIEKKSYADVAPMEAEQTVTASTTINKKKIIKDGSINIRVKNLEDTKHRIDSSIRLCGGYYGTENFNNSDVEISYVLQVRIPNSQFERFIAMIENGNDEILYKQIDARDVTEEFVDLETRLANKRNYLNRYRELLKKAYTIKDILEIEEKIRALEEEIESAEGRLKYLNDQVNYSTLQITVTKVKDFVYKPEQQYSFWEKVKQALSSGFRGIVAVLLLLINIWPLFIVVAVVYVLITQYRKQRNKLRKQ